MKLKNCDIFKDVDSLDYVCITTNSTLNKAGELIMGAGIAKDAKTLYPDLPLLYGKQIKEKKVVGGFYGCLLAKEKFIAFQTKLHWKESSPISVVEKSIFMLSRLATKYNDKVFGLPFPAINNGGLSPNDVYPLLIKLPDNVIVYHIGNLNI